jgi:hypothetical protein
MNRITSLLVATALAALPISAFAQQSAAPVKTAAPTSTTATTTAPVTAPATGKMSEATTTPAKPDVKTPAHGTKSEVHGMNGVKTHVAKASTSSSAVPAKVVAPSKS